MFKLQYVYLVIFFILVNTDLSEAYYDSDDLPIETVFAVGLPVLVIVLLCCFCCCCFCSSSDNDIPTPPEEPPPYYPENRIAYINVTQSGQNEISYNCETTPQFPQFPQRTSMPKNQNLKTNISAQNGTTLSPTHIPSSLSPLPPIPPPYTENSKGEWINGTWVRHV